MCIYSLIAGGVYIDLITVYILEMLDIVYLCS